MSDAGTAATPELLDKRRHFAAAMAQIQVEAGVTVRSVRLGTVPAYDLQPEPAPRHCLLYFHGGGYRMGTAESFAGFGSHLATELSSRVLMVDYRLAPEDPFPAAFEDALDAYVAVAESEPEPILIGGDSAGGGLAAALMLEVAHRNLPRPAAGILLCPWVDMRIEANSYLECAPTDLLWSAASAREAAKMYLASHNPSDPRVSAALGNWEGQPPLLVQASGAEVLRDDARLLAQSAVAAGVRVTHQEFGGESHVWHYGYGSNPVADEAIQGMRRFVDRILVPSAAEVPSII